MKGARRKRAWLIRSKQQAGRERGKRRANCDGVHLAAAFWRFRRPPAAFALALALRTAAERAAAFRARSRRSAAVRFAAAAKPPARPPRLPILEKYCDRIVFSSAMSIAYTALGEVCNFFVFFAQPRETKRPGRNPGRTPWRIQENRDVQTRNRVWEGSQRPGE